MWVTVFKLHIIVDGHNSFLFILKLPHFILSQFEILNFNYLCETAKYSCTFKLLPDCEIYLNKISTLL